MNGACIGVSNSSCNSGCVDKYNCSPDCCPDFVIKRHDTKPPFRADVSDCDGPMDLTDPTLVLEANMWTKGKLKAAILSTDTYFSLADNIGFEQIMVGDIIVAERTRLPEHMLVTAFDETNYLVQVQRGYGDTTAQDWKRGTHLKIYRVLNATATISTTMEDCIKEDGSVEKDQITSTYLEYNWSSNDTCLPGCYWLEFKLLKMAEMNMMVSQEIIPSFTPIDFTSDDFGCGLGAGVEWVRRFPSDRDGFAIKITNSGTAEI